MPFSCLGQHLHLLRQHPRTNVQREPQLFGHLGKHLVEVSRSALIVDEPHRLPRSREVLLKLFDKHHLAIETCNICLRSAPTLPLSLDQPVKHLLLDDLVVTGDYVSTC